jgi:hypothetical protein
MRIMYDGIVPGEVPAGAQLYAAYLDGNWPDYNALVARYPNAVHVSIAVSSSYNGGKVLDVENGDATPAESVNWVLNRRKAGVDPTVYCSMSAWASVQAAFKARGVPQPHYWVADYSLGNNPAIPAGAIALQYADRGGYDVSVVADYWPGVDPAPPATIPPPPPPPMEDDMYLISVTPDPTVPGATTPSAGIFTVDGGTVVHVDEASYNALVARFGEPVVVSPTYYARVLVSAPTSPTVTAADEAAVAQDVVQDEGEDLTGKASG